MIAVIQCAASKREDAGYLRKHDGTPVLFVADPATAPSGDGLVYARPDDPADTGGSWRDALLHYNAAPRNNPLGLIPAFELYENRAYQRLAERFGPEKLFILSAGWGLIRGDFLTPLYDITFSQSVKIKAPHKLRRKQDVYADLCQLPLDTAEPVVFFGGKDYVPLFSRLTQGIAAPKTVFYSSAQPPVAAGCALRKFPTSTRTNWHYECVSAFLGGRIALEP